MDGNAIFDTNKTNIDGINPIITRASRIQQTAPEPSEPSSTGIKEAA